MSKIYPLFKIIQGDTKDVNVSLYNIADDETVSSVYFSSNILNVKKTCTYNSSSKTYDFTLVSSETADFPVGKFTYDITVKFQNGKITTVVHDADGLVEKKTNSI